MQTSRARPGMLVPVLALMLTLASPALGGVIYVDADAPGPGSGTSWGDAFTDLQDALDVAQPGDQVWIADGSYLPSVETAPGDPRSASFTIPDGVELYGGFAGGETSLSQRDPLVNLSILSGDIGSPGPTGDNAYHVVTVANAAAGVRFDGLQVIDGRSNGVDPLDQRGAGLNITESIVTVVGCRIAEHLAPGLGAAIFADGTTTDFTIDASVIESNDSGLRMVDGQLLLANSRLQGNVNGHAAYFSASTATFVNCDITLNDGSTGSVRMIGANTTFRNCRFTDNASGGLSGFSAGNTLVEDCLFQDNDTVISGSAISFQQMVGALTVRRSDFIDNSTTSNGGAVSMHTSSGFGFSECRFVGNHADQTGGAMAISFESITGSSGSPVTNCWFLGNSAANGGALSATGGQAGFQVEGSSPVVTNSILHGNTAFQRGGAVFVDANSEPQFINTTISHNTAGIEGGGVYTRAEGFIPAPGIPEVDFANTILWGNTDSSGSLWGAQVFPEDGIILYFQCDVQGWDGTGSGSGNFAADPMFVDVDGADDVLGTLDDDVQLTSGSPAIDAGDASSLPTDWADLDCDGDTAEQMPLDIGRVGRVDDDVKTPDSGVGPTPHVDLGAWESSAWTWLGNGLGGTTGRPCLVGVGTLVAGTPADHSLTNALPNATGLLFIGLNRIDAPFKLGTLVPFPLFMITLPISPSGTMSLPATWPNGVPSGISVYMQYWIVDPAGPAGFSASNAIQGTTP